MESKWKEIAIGDICELGDGAHAKVHRTASGVPYLTSKNIGNGVLKLDDVDYISEQDYNRLFPRESRAVIRPRPGDILTGIIGTFGNLYLYKEDDEFGISSAIAILRPDQSRVWPPYLYYYLSSTYFRQKHASYAAGSVQGYTNLPTIRQLPAIIPPLPEQRRIAKILGDLDDKIELNRRMNETLEAMARALFKSWFVDFDPVRAKMEGRQPGGMDAETAALFPDKLVDSELGMIPEGWKVGAVSDFVEVERSAINPAQYPEEPFEHYSLPAFDEGRMPKVDLGITIKSNKLILKPGSVLLSKLNPHIPRIWLPTLHTVRRSVCSTEFIVARPRSRFSTEFVYSYLTSSYFDSVYSTLVSGTTGSHQRIPVGSLLELSTSIPYIILVERYTSTVRSLFTQINSNLIESQSLANLRDLLLPKLMGGHYLINQRA